MPPDALHSKSKSKRKALPDHHLHNHSCCQQTLRCPPAGSVPDDLATAPNLQVLDVKNNSLSQLPVSWYTGFPTMVNTSLINLRISFNQFNVSLPVVTAVTVKLWGVGVLQV